MPGTKFFSKKLSSMSKYVVTAREAIDAVKASSMPFVELMKFGQLTVEYYAPVGTDLQNPHVQDELYLIARGHALLQRVDERIKVSAGDLVHVPAMMEHRFVEFSDDFATWVIFFGDVRNGRNSL